MSSTRVDAALDATGQERLGLLEERTAPELQAFLAEYNWDDGVEVVLTLVRHPQCELALALEAFWLTDPDFSSVPPAPAGDEKYDELVRYLYEGIVAGRFPVGELTFDPMDGVVGPRVQRYLLEKRGVPAVFMDPVG